MSPPIAPQLCDESVEMTEFLFGDNLGRTLKDIKEMEKVSEISRGRRKGATHGATVMARQTNHFAGKAFFKPEIRGNTSRAKSYLYFFAVRERHFQGLLFSFVAEKKSQYEYKFTRK